MTWLLQEVRAQVRLGAREGGSLCVSVCVSVWTGAKEPSDTGLEVRKSLGC